jgi:predicted nucleic acid-binding protein
MLWIATPLWLILREKKALKLLPVSLKTPLDKAEVFLCVVNWGEMYYIALREGGDDKAELYRLTLVKYPITIIEANKELTIQAARYKAFQKISYADAYAAALAKLRKAELVTGNKEFKPLEKEITIHWIQ